MADKIEFEVVTGREPYQIVGVTPSWYGHRPDAQPNPSPSVEVQREQLRVGGDSEVAHRVDDPFAFRERRTL